MEFPMIEFLEENGYDVSYVSQCRCVRVERRARCSSSTRYS